MKGNIGQIVRMISNENYKPEWLISETEYQYEDSMQIDYFNWAITTYPQLKGFLFAVPNGGKRNAREAKKLKDMGATAGIPDIISVYGNRIVGIELKLPKKKLSDSQEPIHALWMEQNIEIYTVRTFALWKQIIENIVKL